MRGLADTTAEKINKDFKSRIDAICETLELTLNKIKKPIDEATSSLQIEQMRLLESGKTAQNVLPQLDARLVSLTHELASMTTAMERLLALRDTPTLSSQEQFTYYDDNPRQRDMERLFSEMEHHLMATREIQNIVQSRMPIPKVKKTRRNIWFGKKAMAAVTGDDT